MPRMSKEAASAARVVARTSWRTPRRSGATRRRTFGRKRVAKSALRAVIATERIEVGIYFICKRLKA